MLSTRRVRAVWGILLLLGMASPASAGDRKKCLTCHQTLAAELGERTTPHTARLPCEACHVDYKEACLEGRIATPVLGTLSASVAAKAPRAPDAAAACVRCHAEQHEAYATSVHGRALLEQGDPDAPYCMDCHGPPHALGAMFGDAAAARRRHAIKNCMHCHEDLALADRRGLNPEVVHTYRESIHGKLLALGSHLAAACHDCHGTHEIVRATDPGAKMAAERVAKTCQECHPGATSEFANSFIHRTLDRNAFPLGYWIQLAFSLLTVLCIGALVVHMSLDFFHEITERLRGRA